MLRTFLSVCCTLLLLPLFACGGGRRATTADDGNAAPAAPDSQRSAGKLELTLTAAPEGGNWRVSLAAPEAIDLYQIAGSLDFDPAAYEVLSQEAGGGLGDPTQALYISRETSPGHLDFAYTRRNYGSGASGDLLLYSLLVRPRGAEVVDAAQVTSAFKLDQGAGHLLARDSSKRSFALRLQEVH